MSHWENPGKIEDMVGQTFTKVERVGDSALKFTNARGTFEFSHDGDCCESVDIEDINGDLDDLVGSPLWMASEDNSQDSGGPYVPEHTDSYTWTFYRFATEKGYVNVRWLGRSNGYYSERVDLSFYPA